MKRDQVSKSTSKGSLGTGSFLLKGERDWYRNVQLSLVMFVKEGKLCTVPHVTFHKMESRESIPHTKIIQGNYRKSDAAKKIAEKLNYDDLDEIMRQLPADGFKIEHWSAYPKDDATYPCNQQNYVKNFPVFVYVPEEDVVVYYGLRSWCECFERWGRHKQHYDGHNHQADSGKEAFPVHQTINLRSKWLC
jgi:hypothetical protein